MEPGQVLIVALYLWLAVALGVYAWRVWRRLAHRETRQDRAARRAAGRPVPPAEVPGTRSATATPTEPHATRAPATHRPPVAELVEGIVMPCDLVPLVVGDQLDPHRAVFVTTGHDAAEVHAALSSELERLGFGVRREGTGATVAIRAGSQLHVRFHADAAAATAGDRQLFPTAPPGGVAAELTT